MSHPSKKGAIRVFAILIKSTLMVLLTIALLELTLRGFNLFEPDHRYGDPELGFFTIEGTGKTRSFFAGHWRFAKSDSGTVTVNERGFRTDRTIAGIQRVPAKLGICVIGDSHTDLPYRNDLTHPFVLQNELGTLGWKDQEVFAAGRGKYSPLQAYIYFQKYVQDLHPAVLVLNLYSGNDFFDNIRVDDRPYLQRDSSGSYGVHSPVWYRFSDPNSKGNWADKSHLLFALESVAIETGLMNLTARVRFLLDLSKVEGHGFGTVFRYMRTLAATEEPSIAYPGAYPSQILNQHFFFSFFPDSKKESLHRLDYLFARIRQENPDLILVLSPIPSAVLTGTLESDSTFLAKLRQLDITYESIFTQEKELLDAAIDLAKKRQWATIDNLDTMRNCGNRPGLFMTEDLHLSPLGSSVLGTHEAYEMDKILRKAVLLTH